MDSSFEDVETPRSRSPISSTTPSTVNHFTTTIKYHKSKNGFQKLFSRRKGVNVAVKEIYIPPYSAADAIMYKSLGITPNPNIRPLGRKLVARSEINPVTVSPAIVSRHSVSSSSDQNYLSDTDDQDYTSDTDQHSQSLSLPHEDYLSRVPSSKDFAIESARKIEEVAVSSTMDFTHFGEWMRYMESYSEVSHMHTIWIIENAF
jgi:hypothetical protein